MLREKLFPIADLRRKVEKLALPVSLLGMSCGTKFGAFIYTKAQIDEILAWVATLPVVEDSFEIRSMPKR